jgi:hypothetical protein
LKAHSKRVYVQSKVVHFPSMCPQCLGRTDLTTYASKWKTEYRQGTMKVTEKAQINVPICKSCKKTLLGETRKKYAKYFAISAPICWGLLSLILSFYHPAAWGLEFLFVIFLAFAPLYSLYYTMLPHSEVKWPVKLVSQNLFSIENETYSKLFEAANTSSTPSF